MNRILFCLLAFTASAFAEPARSFFYTSGGNDAVSLGFRSHEGIHGWDYSLNCLPPFENRVFAVKALYLCYPLSNNGYMLYAGAGGSLIYILHNHHRIHDAKLYRTLPITTVALGYEWHLFEDASLFAQVEESAIFWSKPKQFHPSFSIGVGF